MTAIETSESVRVVLEAFRAIEDRDEPRLLELYHPELEFQRIDYEYEQAAATILAGDYWAADNLANEIILNRPNHARSEFFERLVTEHAERS